MQSIADAYPMCHLLLADVVNNVLKTKEYLTVPVTTAEFAVMKTACNVCFISTYNFIRLLQSCQLHNSFHQLCAALLSHA